VLFKLPKLQVESTKENQAQDAPCPLEETAETGGRPTLSSPALAYRSIFAVLTLDSIILYDTHHLEPLCVARGLHYAGLTDCVWSPDGMNLLVTSTDGYVSILGFDDGELGEVYTPPKAKMCPVNNETTAVSRKTELGQMNGTVRMTQPKAQVLGGVVSPAPDTKLIPPCEPGQLTTLVEPPTKRAKKTRIAPTLISPKTLPNKGKKRIAPTLVTTTMTTQSSSTPETETTCAITPDRTSPQRSTMAGNKRPIPTETTQDNATQGTDDVVASAVTHLSLENPEVPKQKKKKKRIQPTLVSTVL
jgi:chromatin assembly factor 1 subunit B